MQVTSGDLDQLSAFGRAPFISKIRCEYWPDVDHTATALYSQKHLRSSLCNWATSIAPAT
jgi:hypothetical protein